MWMRAVICVDHC